MMRPSGIFVRVLLAAILQTLVFSLISSTHHRRMGISNKMFSGIVEEMGQVSDLKLDVEVSLWDGTRAKGAQLTVKLNENSNILEDAYIGCSIAVNGVCLTAIELNRESKEFLVGLAPETLRRTNLPLLKAGDRVNLERALRADGRNSGHFVQGHVDATGEIVEKRKDGDSLWIKVKLPRDYIRFVVPKGFIAIDGTSLTVVDVEEDTFTFMLIAHTQSAVIIPNKNLGDLVNVEVDVLAKMVDQVVRSVQTRLDRIEEILNIKQ